ncbi:MAG: c-type cytochrome [Pedosphaera sp.]|nr:c-type cytochrome [Pedosphaera sp.]
MESLQISRHCPHCLLLAPLLAFLSLLALPYQSAGAPSKEPHVVFVIGENEYNTWDTLPEFAEKELRPQGLRFTYVNASPQQVASEFTNFVAIKEADLLVISVRRRAPRKEMLDLIRAHLAAGKPLVGIRTASHAWDVKPADAEHDNWPTFDVDVLGAKYENHYGRTNTGPQAIIKAVPEATTHPALRGVPIEFPSDSHLYKYTKTSGTVTPLLMGHLASRTNVEMAAWTFTGNNRRVFYTSLGGTEDFKLQGFRTLLRNAVLWALDRPIPMAALSGSPSTLAHHLQEEPLTPSESLQKFHLQDDLEIEQVLAEPVVAQPVFLNFDERGRMWVVQYRQYPFPAGLKMMSRDNVWRAVYDKIPQAPPHHVRGEDKITIHEDTDGDGKFDKHTTFVEGLNICTSVERGRGGVWVLNPPYLLFYPDRNNDDVPDGDPEVRLEGFGLEDTHSVANSLRWGPDGWLYGAQGSTVTAKITVRDSKGRALNDKPIYSQGQNIWRYHPEKGIYEVFSEGGGNAFGVEIDSKGRIFSGHNGGNTRGFHYMQGAYLQKGFEKHGPLSNPHAFGYFPQMPHDDVQRFTHNFIIYDAGALPERYQGKLFGVEPLQGRVVFSDITPDKSSFRTHDLGYAVTSDDQWFRPVDIKVGPDGAIYVCDWYDRQVNHFRNHEGQIDKNNGRIYRIQRKNQALHGPFDLAKLSTGQLVELLEHKNKWYRQQALRLLADRQDRSTDYTRKLIPAPDSLTSSSALEYLWLINLTGGFDTRLAAASLQSADPQVRLWTIRLLGDAKQIPPEVVPMLVERAERDANLEVRGQLASTAKRLPADYALSIVRALLSHDEDTTDNRLPLLLWWAIESKTESDRDAVIGFFSDVALWSHPIVKDHLLDRVMRRYATAGTRQDLLSCARLFAISPKAELTAKLVSGFEAAFKGRSMANLPEELVGAMTKAGARSMVISLRQRQPEAFDEALRVINDDAADKERRLQFVQILGEVKQPRAVDALLGLIGKSNDPALIKASLISLQSYDEPRIGGAVIDAYKSFSEDTRTSALTLLASRSAWALQFLEALDAGRVVRQAVPQDVVRKVKLYDTPRHRELLARTWPNIQTPTTAEMEKQIKRLAGVLSKGTGSPYEGQKLYSVSCGACHKLFGKGGQIGPDLTTFKRDDLENMLLNVVNPNAEIREGYENFLLTTKDGRALSGFIADKDDRVIVLRGLDGENSVLPRDEISEMKAAGASLMPEGMLEALEDQQVRDLFAYLRSTQPLVK